MFVPFILVPTYWAGRAAALKVDLIGVPALRAVLTVLPFSAFAQGIVTERVNPGSFTTAQEIARKTT